MGFTRVIAATDFSPGADRASRRAAELASSHRVPMELLHVVSATGLAFVRARLQQRGDLAERLSSEARGLLDTAAAGLGGIASRLAVGDVVEQLRAASSPESLVVVGAHGEGTFGDLLIGSTSERLVHECAGPVLIVRDEARGPYRRVVVGLDLQDDCEGLLAQVAAFAPDARITALHGYEVPFEGMLHRAGVQQAEIDRLRAEAMGRALDRIGAASLAATGDAHRVLPLAERGDPARLLVERGRSLAADLIVVARRSRPRLHSLLIGSVARRVVAEADRDVLALRGPDVAS